MSRLIVKNLPNKVTVDQLKEIFAQKGEITDVQLKYTKDGKFRNFAFVGYRKEEQAAEAREYFDGTCVKSMKINVEICTNLGDEKKPRAWSKYATDSTAYKILHKDELESKKAPGKKERKMLKNKDKIKALLKKHKEDPLFAEFIEAHVNGKNTWIKDAFQEAVKSDDDSGVEDEQANVEDENITVSKNYETEKKDDNPKEEEKVANKQISDLEYMKLLMKRVGGNTNIDPKTEIKEKQPEEPKKIRNRVLFHVKITGLPFACKKKDIKEFFRPLVPYTIRLPLGKGKKLAGFCYAGFRTDKELKKALGKDKLFIGNHRVHVQEYEDKSKKTAQEEEESQHKKQEHQQSEESIGESGSIFVRNLPYVVSEVEVTELFEKYGPITEVDMPIDQILRQPKGFATVTFMMPEHAVKAYTELDGTAFCGRMLHLLPAKSKVVEEDDSGDEGLSYKDKKAKKLKAQAKSSHNWNTLFLGANAVADVVAANYNTTKENLLSDNNTNTSAAVRLALGETQLVAETRKFLESNGVFLESFSKPPKRRSKTCILVKNLPANTHREEVKSLFVKHGQLSRFLMPNNGITALVDFIEPFEAKKAFSRLAYSQFKTSPLYLEWAPENIFVKGSIPNISADDANNSQVQDYGNSRSYKSDHIEMKNQEVKQAEEEEEDLGDPESNTTLFVKNLNFRTTEEDLKHHFLSCGKPYSVKVARKKDPKNPGQSLSMGYGFVQYYKKESANEALKCLQGSTLDGKTLELKRSDKENTAEVKTTRKSTKEADQNGSKILVRNVPFQANRNELLEIFKAFGDIKTLRLPKKMAPGTDQHRGFAFIDFYTKSDAKSAFETLCHSTHLYGRRLVLEWAEQQDENEDVSAIRKRTAKSFNAVVPGGKKTRKGAVDVENFVEGGDDE